MKSTSSSLKNFDESKVAIIPHLAQIYSSKIKKIRFRLGQLFESISNGLVFPVLLIKNIPKSRLIASSSKQSQLMRSISYGILYGEQLVPILGSLSLTIIATIFYLLSMEIWSVRWAVISMLSASFLIFSLVMYGASLPKVFKLQIGNPYVRFIVFGVGSGAVFLFGVLFLRVYVLQVDINHQIVIDTARDLFSFSQIFNKIVNFNNYSALSIIEILLALLFYVTVAGSIFRWKDFIRSDDDKNSIARNLVVIGKYKKSLEWMESANASYAKIRLTKSMALLSINRIDQGLEELDKELSETNLEIFDLHFMALCLGNQYCLPEHISRKLFDKWLNNEPDSSLLVLILQGAPIYFSNEVILQIELDSRVRSRPIHHAILLLCFDKIDEVSNLLESFSPDSDFEKIVCLIIDLKIGLSANSNFRENLIYVHDWLDTKFPLIDSYAKDINERELFVVIILMLIPIALLRSFKVDREDEILYQRNELKNRISFVKNNVFIENILKEQEKQLSI